MNIEDILKYTNEPITIALEKNSGDGFFLYSPERFENEIKFPMRFYNIISISFEKQTVYTRFNAELYRKYLEIESAKMSHFF